jgi:hypothetical protein
MWSTAGAGKTFTNNATVFDDDTTDKRIGRRNRPPLLGELDRARHHGVINSCKSGHLATLSARAFRMARTAHPDPGLTSSLPEWLA